MAAPASLPGVSDPLVPHSEGGSQVSSELGSDKAGPCGDCSRRTFLGASLAGVTGLMLGLDAHAADADALAFLSIHEASTQLRARKISPVELTRACLGRIAARNAPLNAFITVT